MYSFYSYRCSLCAFSCTATWADRMLPAIIGMGPEFTASINITPVKVVYVLVSSRIAR